MNNEQYLALAEKELAGVLALIKKKNSDYSGGSDDALANFKLCEKLGLAEGEIGVLIRMMDKVQRIKSFLAKGELQVPNESAQDAVRDIIGYSVALLGMLEDRQQQEPPIIIQASSCVAKSSVQPYPYHKGVRM